MNVFTYGLNFHLGNRSSVVTNALFCIFFLFGKQLPNLLSSFRSSQLFFISYSNGNIASKIIFFYCQKSQ